MNGGDGKYFAKMHSVRRSGNTFNSGKRIFLDCIMKTQELIIGCCGETGVRPAFIPDCYFHTWELAGRNFFFFWSGHDQSVFVTGKLGFLAPRAPASFPREFNANSMTDDPAKGLLPNPYDGPKLLTSYSMHGNDSYVLEDLSKYISSIVKTRTRKHVESLLQNKSWLRSELRYFGDVSFLPKPVLIIS